MTWRKRLFHFWFRLSRPMTLGVRALAFDDDGRLLLVRHSYVPGWHLPGGGVEPGDTLEETLAKELLEETNAQTMAAPRLLSVHFNRQASRRDHVAVYHCPSVRQSAPKNADREILEAKFFALDDLPDNVTKATLQRIAEWRGDTPVSPYW
jgi:ADP-ribose pyrophosphatase YjhB (NUDIX family)